MALSKHTPTLTSGYVVVRETDSTASPNNDVKTGAATIHLIQVNNAANASTTVYLKLYNNAAPTVGTTAPDLVIPAAGGATVKVALPGGFAFATALSFATVTDGGGTAGTTSPTSDVSVVLVIS